MVRLFLSEDAKVYPFWAKYWAFQGMLKLGTYDKAKGIFNKRDKNTISPFVDLNREALAMSIDLMIKILNKEEIDDKELENLVKTGSFQKIYTHILTKVLNNNKNIIKRNIGEWVKYNQGSDHLPLVKSLEGYNTGWCTAGECTAKNQLKNGDFYVYYTLDENDEYKVPRVAIRMEYGKIGEIRGIAKDQNLESEMEEVVKEKIKDFPDKEEYYRKVNDMKLLTHIYKKHNENKELTKEELRFLYEIDENIMGFGYGHDPRIKEIIEKRNKKKDLSYVLNCKEEQIALNHEQFNKETIYFEGSLFEGNLNLEKETSAKDLILPKYIKGSLSLNSLISAEGLVLPKRIYGDLDLKGLKNAKGLVLPQSIGNLWLNTLISVEDLVLPQSIGGYVIASLLKNAENLVLPKSAGRGLIFNSLRSAEGLIIPEPLTYTIYMNGFEITPQNVNEYRSNKKSDKSI